MNYPLFLRTELLIKYVRLMDKILNLDSVDLYNKLYGLETLNPLVSVIDLNKATSSVDLIRFNYGIYALYLKLEKACDIKYGRQTYDYQEGTIVCFAPGQTAETNPTTDKVQVNAHGILFHPDLLRGTSLGKSIKKYTFFSYEVNEALHLSEEEISIVMDCLKIIRMELEHGVDKHSKTLLVNHIELLLNYCMRFYERQFITRGKTNRDVLTRFENLLDEYFESTLAEQDGLPTVKYFADKLCLSSNYFGDMFKKETGKSPQEYIQEKVIELAKERISDTADTVSQIAYSLGFQYPQHFCRLFKKRVGYTPSEYRAQIGLSTNL
jgi:AraC-like DNA-binding protein